MRAHSFRSIRIALIIVVVVGMVAALNSINGIAQTASKPEVLTDVKVLEIDRKSLVDLGVNPISFVLNVSQTAAQALADAPRSKTLQSFQLTSLGDDPARFRVASRLMALDAGVDFELVTKVSPKREISMQVVSQVRIRRADDVPAEADPLFIGHPMRQDIITAEGAIIVLGGFVTEEDAGQLTKIVNLQSSPLLRYIVANEEPEEPEIIVVLTPHVVRAPKATDIAAVPVNVAAPPAVVAPATPPAAPRAATPAPASAIQYTVQVGAFKREATARQVMDRLIPRYPDAFVQVPLPGHTFYLVRVGKKLDFRAATQILGQLRAEGYEPLISRLE